jgi:hypothetical protein
MFELILLIGLFFLIFAVSTTTMQTLVWAPVYLIWAILKQIFVAIGTVIIFIASSLWAKIF